MSEWLGCNLLLPAVSGASEVVTMRAHCRKAPAWPHKGQRCKMDNGSRSWLTEKAKMCDGTSTQHPLPIGVALFGPSWPSSPPHWLSQKRNGAHVKPPSLSYFIDFVGLYRLGGLMVSMLASVNKFSWVLASVVFDSWCMHIFFVGSNLAFLRVFGYFLFPIGIFFSLMFFFDLTWH